MLTASELRAGLAVRIQGVLYKVLAADYHSGQGKMGGVAHVRLRNLETGTLREWRFRGDEVVDEVQPERQTLQFIYREGDLCYFMHPETFEQTPIDAGVLGRAALFLDEQAMVPVEFVEGRPVGILFPEIVEVRIADTAPPAHAQGGSNVWKEARLDNGLVLQVPPFIAPGEAIRVEVERGTYVERAKTSKR